jgi:hypothetical protein
MQRRWSLARWCEHERGLAWINARRRHSCMSHSPPSQPTTPALRFLSAPTPWRRRRQLPAASPTANGCGATHYARTSPSLPSSLIRFRQPRQLAAQRAQVPAYSISLASCGELDVSASLTAYPNLPSCSSSPPYPRVAAITATPGTLLLSESAAWGKRGAGCRCCCCCSCCAAAAPPPAAPAAAAAAAAAASPPGPALQGK